MIKQENNEKNQDYSPEDIRFCINMLKNLVHNSQKFAAIPREEQIDLLTFAGKLSRPNREEIKKRNKAREKAHKQKIKNIEREARATTGIRRARKDEVFKAPLQITDLKESIHQPELKSPGNCYICKAPFTRLHFFYDSMCPECAELNYRKRFQTASLHGQTALITGSRVKIGYQAVLKMLRAGAVVIATTRFPVDSAQRYAREDDFPDWKDRLHIYGLDLRHTPSVEMFSNYVIQTYDRLDILINNAAQTVRRPPHFYKHLMENEMREIHTLPGDMRQLLNHYQECKNKLNILSHADLSRDKNLPMAWNDKSPGIGLWASARLSQIPYDHNTTVNAEEVFPKGELDADLQQVDLRMTNSWRLKIGEINTSEMIELQLINAIAPFVLCNRLIPLMKKENTGQKHVVNVSAMEGKFLRFKKDSRHPHTNMAKAALNMLTHSSAGDLAKSGIFMNAVDTGWVTDEDPALLVKQKQELHDFQPPLDIVDGAARVCDPFFHGILTGKHWCGKFLKDYFPIDW